MLLRMYVRWGEKQRYKTKVVEKSMGEEAGIKSATIEVEGRYAYGYLSGEKGTHRIVRQSPFNAKGLRQVSHVCCLLLSIDSLFIYFFFCGWRGGRTIYVLICEVCIIHLT